MTPVRLDPEAEVELREAAAWYAKRAPAAARRFLDRIRETAHMVSPSPAVFPALQDPEVEVPVRRALVSGFPYALVFILTESEIHVLAVAHLRREPGYWLNRLRQP